MCLIFEDLGIVELNFVGKYSISVLVFSCLLVKEVWMDCVISEIESI